MVGWPLVSVRTSPSHSGPTVNWQRPSNDATSPTAPPAVSCTTSLRRTGLVHPAWKSGTNTASRTGGISAAAAAAVNPADGSSMTQTNRWCLSAKWPGGGRGIRSELFLDLKASLNATLVVVVYVVVVVVVVVVVISSLKNPQGFLNAQRSATKLCVHILPDIPHRSTVSYLKISFWLMSNSKIRFMLST